MKKIRKMVTEVLLVVLVVSMFMFSAAAIELEAEQINEIKNQKILVGDLNGNLNLSGKITRAEAVTILYRLAGAPEVAGELKFNDVRGHWAEKAIKYAFDIGVIKGTREDTFEPEYNITFVEFSKIIVCLLGYESEAVKLGGYPHGYIKTASELGLTEGIVSAVGDELTRAETAMIFLKALDVPLMMQTSFGAEEEYQIMNGENGVKHITLRKKMEEDNADVPRFNGEEYTGRVLQIVDLKEDNGNYTFRNGLNKEDNSVYIIDKNTFIYISENTVELKEIKEGMYAQCWHFTDAEANIPLLKIEIMKNKPSGI